MMGALGSINKISDAITSFPKRMRDMFSLKDDKNGFKRGGSTNDRSGSALHTLRTNHVGT
jgi:hypothetical protein